MIPFTNEQEAAVQAERRAFNARQNDMVAQAAIIGNAATVGLDAWRRIDGRAQRLQRDVLAVSGRLMQANTTPVGIGDIISYFPRISDSGSVNVSLDGRNNALGDQATVAFVGTPIPIVDSVVRFGWRQMEVMRKTPMGLDVESIANSQRKVAEKVEDIAINGLPSIVVGGSTIYGLRNFPDRTTGTHGLTLSSATGAQWLTAMKAVVNGLVADNAFGKVTFFVNYADWVVADQTDYAANYPKTIRERILELAQVAEIVPASKVPPNEILGIAGLDTGDWGSMLVAMPMVTRPKTRVNTEDDYVFAVMAMMAPQFRSDGASRSHIAHWTTA
jgi:uncharacterized linocin/CFP29 family protein